MINKKTSSYLEPLEETLGETTPLETKRPTELIAEMETLIANMNERHFDNEKVEAYLAVLQEKVPVMESLDVKAALDRFLFEHGALLEKASPAALPTGTAARQKRPHAASKSCCDTPCRNRNC